MLITWTAQRTPALFDRVITLDISEQAAMIGWRAAVHSGIWSIESEARCPVRPEDLSLTVTEGEYLKWTNTRESRDASMFRDANPDGFGFRQSDGPLTRYLGIGLVLWQFTTDVPAPISDAYACQTLTAQQRNNIHAAATAPDFERVANLYAEDIVVALTLLDSLLGHSHG